MEIDYIHMIKLINLRIKQIEDIALLDTKYNIEYLALIDIRAKCYKILKA